MQKIKDNYWKEFENLALNGRENLIHNIKLILFKDDSEFFEYFDFHSEQLYLEPFLFSYLTTGSINHNINDLLWYYAINSKKVNLIKVCTDSYGYFYLPKIGYFISKKPKIAVSILFNDSCAIEKLSSHLEFENIRVLNDEFELITRHLEVLDNYFYDENDEDVYVNIEDITQYHLKSLENAIRLIQVTVPKFYNLLKTHVRTMVIFSDSTLKRNSFASQSIHGCVFFNAFDKNYNEVFFIEDLAHQGAHVVFNAYLSSSPSIFRVNKEQLIYMKDVPDEYNEPRPLFIVLHAMYTYNCIFDSLSECLKQNIFKSEPSKEHEVLGRLAYTAAKFNTDYYLLLDKDDKGQNKLLTIEGEQLLNSFFQTYKKVLNCYSQQIKASNLSEQPYNFSYQIFLKHNPLKNA